MAVYLIKGYQYCISPYLGSNCKYHPSCSSYAIEAFQKKGFIKGFLLTGYRLLRCNPFSKGGFDPVDKSDYNEMHDVLQEVQRISNELRK